MKSFKFSFCSILLFLFSNKLSAQQDSLIGKLDTINNISALTPKQKFKITPYILPISFISYGFLSLNDHGKLRHLDINIRNDINRNHSTFSTNIDNYLLFVPAMAFYGLNLTGVKGKHNLLDATVLYAGATGLSGLTSVLLKENVNRLRPDGSGNKAFPSGHTALIFAAAEFLKQEYADVSPWYACGGYAVAVITGTLRIYNNKHWFSDVIAGAGIGIISTKISYLLYPYFKQLFMDLKSKRFSVIPYYQEGMKGIVINGRF